MHLCFRETLAELGCIRHNVIHFQPYNLLFFSLEQMFLTKLQQRQDQDDEQACNHSHHIHACTHCQSY